MSDREDLANNIMGLVQKARVDSEGTTEDDWRDALVGILQSALDNIETLCREFISAQHE